MGTFTINSAEYVNRPPDIVGDYTLLADCDTAITLSSNMFTTDTNPPANDPEGDAFDAIKITAIDGYIDVLYDGNPVSVGDIITLQDIDNNLLTVEVDCDAEGDIYFKLRDVGSNEFSDSEGTLTIENQS